LGEDGQRRLAQSTALVAGCGALGSASANLLVRAGVGTVRLVDRDFVELDNLQRQVLYDEADVAQGLPKAIAAERHLRQINSEVRIEAHVADVEPGSILALARGADVILDGLDNFETRYLVNDVSVHLKIPWVYAGCLGADGQTMTIVPGVTPCLACLMGPEPPPASVVETCDTAGVLGSIVTLMASIQVAEAIKVLSGNVAAISRKLTAVDLWQGHMRQLDLGDLGQDRSCPTCGRGELRFLSGDRAGRHIVLCGRNAVQMSPAHRQSIDLLDLARRLEPLGTVVHNDYLVRIEFESYQVAVFADGRAIITGTDDPARARTLYARLVGN
jgi:adenylyltransferase/sulfurtransferase